jgi:hypothetical protein
LAFRPREPRYFRALAQALEAGEKYAEAMSVWEEALKHVGDEAEGRTFRVHIKRLAEKVKERA